MSASRAPPSSSSSHSPASTSTLSYIADMQQKTRKARKFAEAEAGLPKLTPHSPLRMLSPEYARKVMSVPVSDTVSNILSYMGTKNPLPQAVRKDEEVWLLDNTAFASPTQPGRWEAEFIACVFTQHASCKVADAVLQVANTIGLADDDKAKQMIESRIMPFLMDIQPGKQVLALHGGELQLTLGPGGRNGISSDTRYLPAAPAGMLVPSTAEVPHGTTGMLQMKTFFAEPEGWAVISDIDDTIKITQTSDPIGILRSTFIDEPTPTPGMPELYKFLQSELTATAPFFYLSASPYNLYPFLRQFRDRYYPHGTLVLRDESWMSIPGLLSNLTLGTENYKADRMKKIHKWLPKRKMIVVGDSTQSDPEAYGDIYRAFPDWIKIILIRKVTDIAAIGIESKNEPERFEKAFKDVPRSVWHVFDDPAECYQIIRDAVV